MAGTEIPTRKHLHAQSQPSPLTPVGELTGP